MRIVLCASAYFVDEVKRIKEELERMGYEAEMFFDVVEYRGRKINVKGKGVL